MASVSNYLIYISVWLLLNGLKIALVSQFVEKHNLLYV